MSAPGALAPLRGALFRAFWLANLGSMVGTWVHQVGAAWLMTTLTRSPLEVALVSAAQTLPMCLLALPAGALADALDRRRLLMGAQVWMAACAGALGLLTCLGLVTPWVLLALTAMLGLGSAIHAPTWQSSIPELVSREDLPAAVALGSVGFNLARSVGPALGGLLVGAAGPGAAFLLNAGSFVGVLLVALGWRREVARSALPAERLLAAIAGGLRYVRHEPRLAVVIARGALFVSCASGLWALLPVVAREDLGLSATHYGLLVGCMGAGAVLGAVLLARVRRRLTLERVVVVATLVMAGVVVGVARVRRFELLCPLLLPGGAAWLWLLSSLNTAVQSSVPGWIRGRAISVYLLAFFGAHAGGSALWGWVAGQVGSSDALHGVALGLAGGVLLVPLLRLPSGELLDLSPSQHWPTPRVAEALQPGAGPVLVTIEYEVAPERAPELLRGLEALRRLRLRDGGSAWQVFQDAERPERWCEQFQVASWEAHLRQHERVTVADRAVQERVNALHRGPEPPRVRHLLARHAPPTG